jgi:purine-nucleoside phosphorylase
MIGVIFALGFEAKNFKKRFSNSNIKYCIINATGLRIAEEIHFIIRKNNIQCIVLTGFAGGLNDSLCVGDVVLAKNYTSTQFLPYFEANAASFKMVHLVTVNHVLETCAAKEQCRQESGADCCDMETAHVWRVAQSLSIPMITVRSISDAKNSDMPIPGDILIDPRTSRPNTLRLIEYLLRHPKHVPGFIRMVQQASHAAKRLAEVAQQEMIPRIKRALTQKSRLSTHG